MYIYIYMLNLYVCIYLLIYSFWCFLIHAWGWKTKKLLFCLRHIVLDSPRWFWGATGHGVQMIALGTTCWFSEAFTTSLRKLNMYYTTIADGCSWLTIHGKLPQSNFEGCRYQNSADPGPSQVSRQKTSDDEAATPFDTPVTAVPARGVRGKRNGAAAVVSFNGWWLPWYFSELFMVSKGLTLQKTWGYHWYLVDTLCQPWITKPLGCLIGGLLVTGEYAP